MEIIKSKIKKTPYIDPQTGDYNLKYNIQNINEDFFIPQRGNDTSTKIDTLSGLQYNAIEDVNYLRDKTLAALKIPKAFFGYEKDLCISPETRIPILDGRILTAKELIDDFRKSGLIHIVVLSGYNITIVADSIRRMLSFLPRVIGIVLGGLGILFFGILVGGGATVIRSCIMAIIALLGSLMRRDYNVGKALFIAGVLMLIQNPLILLYDPSFQLSFLATLGLIFLSYPIENKLNFVTDAFGIRGLIASTLATQIFVSPYILYMMGQLSIIGIIVNILVLPIIPMTMFFVAVTGLIGFISESISQISAWISHLLLSYELFMVRFFASLSFSSIQLPKFPFTIVVGLYLIYFVMLVKLPSTFSQFKFWKKSST
jgi:competence protein ComEC